MTQYAFVFFDYNDFGRAITVNAQNQLVFNVGAAYNDNVADRRDVILEIHTPVAGNASLTQMRDAVQAAVIAKGAEYGYTALTGPNLLLPSFQRGV